MVEDTKSRVKILVSAEGSSAPVPLSRISIINGGSPGQEGGLGELTLYRCVGESERNKRCEIIFPQSEYLKVVEHLSKDTTCEHGGFLLGYESCMGDSSVPVVVITEAVPAKFTEGTPVRLTFTTDTWRHLDDEMAERYRDSASVPQRVGWYHSHPDISIFLSHWDLDVCTTFERRNYPIALVVDPVKKQGGFFVGGEKGYHPHSPQGFYEAHNTQTEPIVAWVNLTRVGPAGRRSSRELREAKEEGARTGFKITRDTPGPRPARFVRQLALNLLMATMVAAVSYLFIGQRSSERQVRLLASEINALRSKLPRDTTLTLPPAIEVSVSPHETLLAAAQQQDFTPSVIHAVDTRVGWSISPQVGLISKSGIYSAPALIKKETVVIVMATSVADPSKVGVATVTLRPDEAPRAIATLTIRPNERSVRPSESVRFKADVTGPGNHQVTWSIEPVDRGKIETNGLYTAPSSLPADTTVKVIATSKTDSSKSVTAIVTLVSADPPPGVRGGTTSGGTDPSTPGGSQPTTSESSELKVEADKSALSEGEHAKLTASVGGKEEKDVDWTLNEGAAGSITSGDYAAPSEIKVGGDSVIIKATSRENSKNSGSVKITLQRKNPETTVPH